MILSEKIAPWINAYAKGKKSNKSLRVFVCFVVVVPHHGSFNGTMTVQQQDTDIFFQRRESIMTALCEFHLKQLRIFTEKNENGRVLEKTKKEGFAQVVYNSDS